MVPLSLLPLRQPARIVEVGGGRSFRRRLLELGFLPGTEVTLLGVAPMGDPLDLELRGCRYSLRRAEAEAIAVLPDHATVTTPVSSATTPA
jgi:Fe2+ transport system protein FeoA